MTIFGPYIAADSEKAGHPRTDQFNHPTDVAVDSDGDIYVCDWGNHRVCVFDSEGGPITTLIGDAQILSKWGQQSIDANPDMMKARRRVKSLEPQWRFCFPTAGRVRCRHRLGDRRRQPAQPAADLQEGPQLLGLPGQPVSRVPYRAQPRAAPGWKALRRPLLPPLAVGGRGRLLPIATSPCRRPIDDAQIRAAAGCALLAHIRIALIY